VVAAALLAMLASAIGLTLSFHADVPTGPAIVLTAGALWLVSLAAGPQGSLLAQILRRPHFAG
jgi:zinc/manganese transport system permease protein